MERAEHLLGCFHGCLAPSPKFWLCQVLHTCEPAKSPGMVPGSTYSVPTAPSILAHPWKGLGLVPRVGSGGALSRAAHAGRA